MDETLQKVIIAGVGLLVGFLFNWFLAERKAQAELRRAVAEKKVAAYRDLWPLCRKDIEHPGKRLNDMAAWYHDGGGLFLTLKAMVRWKSACAVLRLEKWSDAQQKQLTDDLSWLRTEMKVAVGTYTRKDAKTQL